jgi:F-type H+-transporting ATPase subunit b
MLASSNFLVPNTTFIVELVIFLVVLWLLAKYVLPVLNRAMEARQEAIERSIKEAEETKQRAKELEEERTRLLEQGREEARRLRDEAAKIGEQLRQELQRKGEDDYQRRVATAGAEIEAAARKAAEELRSQVSELVIAVVERVLQDGIPSTTGSDWWTKPSPRSKPFRRRPWPPAPARLRWPAETGKCKRSCSATPTRCWRTSVGTSTGWPTSSLVS